MTPCDEGGRVPIRRRHVQLTNKARYSYLPEPVINLFRTNAPFISVLLSILQDMLQNIGKQ